MTELLRGAPPESVRIRETDYEVYSDFRYGVLLSELFSEPHTDGYAKARLSVKLLSPALEKGVEDGALSVREAFEAVLYFYTCGIESSRTESRREREPALDFSFDAERIFATFWRIYRIDLSEDKLHWWKFIALLRGLPGDCDLMRVMWLRRMDISEIRDEEARKRARAARAAVRIRRRER